jgi:hypothetical protein
LFHGPSLIAFIAGRGLRLIFLILGRGHGLLVNELERCLQLFYGILQNRFSAMIPDRIGIGILGIGSALARIS